ncbi:MAG: hypothetical protein J0L61_11295 [Planctomycetes bacterium]|nr:hypothetical protein [Planctomycetota bacterium]
MGRIEPLVISAPFGNYVQPRWRARVGEGQFGGGGIARGEFGATPTLGTFTNERRPGRVWRIVRTVRYSPFLNAWVNKIGLRNPGIDWLAGRVKDGRARVDHALVSVHGFNDAEWDRLTGVASGLGALGVELNMSCPNVGHVNWPEWLFERAVSRCSSAGCVLVVKLPPVNFEVMVERALGAGVRALHCCNTIPVPAGGVSGKPLKPVAIQCIGRVREVAARGGHAGLTIIGGGGVTTPGDIDDYANAGATRAAIGTKCFNPRVLLGDAVLRPLIQRAAERFAAFTVS